MKKLLLFFLTILIPTIAAADESGICGDYVTYLYSSDTNTLTISGTGAMTDYENQIDVPWWKYRDKINTVIVEEGITRIGNSNFDMFANLTSVSLPGSLESIGLRAFGECSSLESLELPANIKVIEDKAFTGCTSLKAINLPSGLSKINYGSFASCGLVSVTIPEGVETIGEFAFGGCKNLVSVSIPNSVTSIDDYAFCECENLSPAEIPNNVIDIGSYAFAGCGLTSIYIPQSVKNIKENPFTNCKELKTIVVDKNNPNYDSREDCNAIIETQSDKIIAGTSNTIIPESVTSIDIYAFAGCGNLKEISLSDRISSIGSYAFQNCVSLTSIRIPKGVSVINSHTFSGCTSLTTLTITENVTSIDYNAFSADNLKEIFVLAQNPPKINPYSFYNKTGNCIITVPDGCSEAYNKASDWSSLGTIVEASGFKLMYVVDGEIYKIIKLQEGANVTPEPAPTREGYTFSGWSDVPSTMPANDVTVTGTFTINKYKLIYKVDGEVYKEYEVEYGASITPETDPTKEGYGFSGWSEIPTTMPANDVIITGTFTKSAFKLIYIVDGEVYKTISYDYGASITPEADPTKEGYTFSGWSDVPSTMPANDVTVTGTFTINKYKLSYKVDGEVYKEYEVEYGASITPETDPTKEGYGFSGWSEIPTTMPANDVTVTGTFTINKYKLIYKVDGEVYKTISYDYGASITPEADPTKEGYTFSGWSDVPSTMPANDVTVTGTFTINKYKLIYKVDGEVYKEYQIEYGASITPEAEPTKEGYQFSGWSWIPNKMPAEDVIITGTFTKSAFKLTYIVDGEVYKTISYDYGASITPEAVPTKEGYTFSGWSDVPSTMPANDVTVTGTFTINKYKLIYKVDGEVYKEYEVEYGASITPEAEPTKEGYQFSGWSWIPNKMPAEDVIITGTFKQIDFNVDGIIYEISAEGNVTIMGGNQKGNLVIEGTIQINGQPYNVTAIAENAFRDNTNIISVTIADGITAIGDNAFNGCIGLLMINIGKNVATIGNKAFANIGTYTAARRRGESSLFVNCYAENVPQTALDAFENSPVESGTLLVDDNLVDSFKTSSPWSGFGKIQGFQEAAGINSIINSPQGARIYDLQGNRLDNIRKGVNIIRTKDGKANKVMMK